jgi:(R)-citramalate synthase
MARLLEIMDTTLRDGEQTSGVSFSAAEKLAIAQVLLNDLKVDRIEVASARVSEGELNAVKKIINWAKSVGFVDKIEVLTFLDGSASIDWMNEAGAKVMNLLTKGSLNHLQHQLKKTPEMHFADIKQVIDLATASGITVNVYLEDWSNGMKNSQEYVLQYLDFLVQQNVRRILLPDTLGVLTPRMTFMYLDFLVKRYPNIHFDFHGHNDYDFSNANAMEAIHAGVAGIHVTINGLGERTGNASISSAIAAINDFFPDIKTNVEEGALYSVSKLVESFSGLRISPNTPIVGESVFTQTAGIHADGDKKNKLYVSELSPERFGRKTSYALGKTSGKANIEQNLKELGLELGSDDLKKLTAHIIDLGDKKEHVTREDLPYIIADILDSGEFEEKVKIESYLLTHAKGLKPSATIKLKIGEVVYEESGSGDGQYDAFMNALKYIYQKQKLELPTLLDYYVHIPPGGKSDALCETVISWAIQGRELKTRGLDSDQTVAAIKATEKMLNLI